MRQAIGWSVWLVFVLVGSVLVVGGGAVRSTADAAPSPNPGQIAQCQSAATGHHSFTKSDMAACANFPSISQQCPSGSAVRVISVNSNNVAIRLGQAPARLSKNYTVSQLKAVCHKTASKSKPKNGTAAPTPPKSGSSDAALKSVSIPSTLAGTAHPVFSPGPLGKLDIVYTGAAYSPGGETADGTIVPFAVWNGTTKSVQDLSASGTASLGGKVVGSGNSQDIEPPNLARGQVAFGIIFFQTATPAGATFNISASSEADFSNTLVAQVTQANEVPGSFSNDVVGSITNPNKQPIMGPLGAYVFCFNSSNMLSAVETGYASGNGPWAPGATASYDTSLEDPCPTFLVGASGFSD